MFPSVLFSGKDEVNLVLFLLQIIGRVSTETAQVIYFPLGGKLLSHFKSHNFPIRVIINKQTIPFHLREGWRGIQSSR